MHFYKIVTQQRDLAYLILKKELSKRRCSLTQALRHRGEEQNNWDKRILT
jgi:hypothetical protein